MRRRSGKIMNTLESTGVTWRGLILQRRWVGWPLLIVLVALLAMQQHGPVSQFAHYHDFADQRRWLGLPNAADVLSNLGFALVGLYGLALVGRQRANPQLAQGSSGYVLFFGALFLTACGSAWYHLAPDNARLVWDRLPIALACAGLLAAVWRETAHAPRGLTTILAVFAALSVAWWRYTDLQGSGDLRPYILLQGLPLVLIPLLQWQHARPVAERRGFMLAMGLYVLAKICESSDHSTFVMLGQVSGHTLKHLLAALAAATIAWNLTRRLRG
jgi:hypothetical protein